MPFDRLIATILNRAKLEVFRFFNRTKDIYFYNDSFFVLRQVGIKSHINVNELPTSLIDQAINNDVIDMYLAHRFDLLGSGWVKSSYDSVPLGVSGIKYHNNVSYNKKKLVRRANFGRFDVLSAMIGHSYEPIDWQKDFKSGYRWSAKQWYLTCRDVIGVKKGVDIKVPWELARMQHLPYMAIYAVKNTTYRQSILLEFKHQVLDFISTNPPRMGVNWLCTMDVGIRAANILIAYDILRNLDSDTILNNEFEGILSRSIYEHGIHIVNNLEWSERLTSNHYLANVVGLLFISSYLDTFSQVDTWLAFSIQEVLDSFQRQFHQDGSNFEASTSYHRLSGEMIIYGIAVMLGLPQEKLLSLLSYNPEDWRKKPRLKPLRDQVYEVKKVGSNLSFSLPDFISQKIVNMGGFSQAISSHLNLAVQIGDNDSGRFVKISSQGQYLSNATAEKKYLNLSGYNELALGLANEERFWDENTLDHRSFIAAINGLYDSRLFEFDAYPMLEEALIKAIRKRNSLNIQPLLHNKSININEDVKEGELVHKQKYTVSLGKTIKEKELERFYYPDFGLCVFKNEQFFLSVYFGDIGQNGNGGHAHNDKLSFELIVDKDKLYFDPGTYLYTPDLRKRDLFRSIEQHNSPRIKGRDIEQNRFISRFSMSDDTRCELLEFTDASIKVLMQYSGVIITRTLKIRRNELHIIDESNIPLMNYIHRPKLFSTGYGKLEKIEYEKN